MYRHLYVREVVVDFTVASLKWQLLLRVCHCRYRCTGRTDSSLKWTRHLWNNRHGLQRTDWEESLREIASQKSLIIFSKAFVVCFSYDQRWITLLRTLLSPRGSIEVVSKLFKLYQINHNRVLGLMLEKGRLYL